VIVVPLGIATGAVSVDDPADETLAAG